jgi:hypothetical protein
MNRAVTYVAVYKPKPGKDAEVLALVKRHVPALRKEGLATNHPVLLLKASDGSLIEIASWQSEDSARAAHANPRVMEIWGAFAACCDFQPLAQLAEAQQEFAHFERLEGVVS